MRETARWRENVFPPCRGQRIGEFDAQQGIINNAIMHKALLKTYEKVGQTQCKETVH